MFFWKREITHSWTVVQTFSEWEHWMNPNKLNLCLKKRNHSSVRFKMPGMKQALNCIFHVKNFRKDDLYISLGMMTEIYWLWSWLWILELHATLWALLQLRVYTEFRFESPISISKLNNYSDFGRKSENYFNVKIFSDSRPKSAQNLILKVFSYPNNMQTFGIFQKSGFSVR